jgi:hypothetical protein
LDKTRDPYSGIVSRRCFFCSIAEITFSALVVELPFWTEGSSKIVTVDHQYLFINGWVLIAEDYTALEMASDVV